MALNQPRIASMSNESGRLNASAPPSAVVRFLTVWKLKPVMSAWHGLPVGRRRWRQKSALHPRGTKRPPELSLHVILGLKLGTNGCGVEQGVDGIVLDGPAPKSTGMTTLVRGPICARMESAETTRCWGSMSTITGVAPQCNMMLAVAAYVMAGMMTSSPGPTPNQRNANSHAVVQLEKPTTCGTVKNAASSFQTPPTLDQM